MKNLKNRKGLKLQGFTLIEIVISLLISSILLYLTINLIVTLISIGSKQSKLSASNSDILLIKARIDDIFLKSESIKIRDTFSIDLKQSDLDSLCVYFLPTGILFDNESIIDTIKINIKKLVFTRLKEDSSYVKMLDFTIELNKLEFPLNFVKDYTNQDLFKIENNAH